MIHYDIIGGIKLKIAKKVEQLLRMYPEVYKHSCNVRDLATDFAMFLGYSAHEVFKIRQGAYIHDVGKAFIHADVLLKEGKLTNEEFDLIKTHSNAGYEYLINHCGVQDPDILAIVLQHHERLDGKGYPLGKEGHQIHSYAKIVSLCDVYDAITGTRSYKVAYSASYALYSIEEGLGTQFCSELGRKFLSFMKNRSDKTPAMKKASFL